MFICGKGYCKSVGDDVVGMFGNMEECPACKEIIKKAKEWFGNGEVDMNDMINSGLITEKFIVNCYRVQVLNEPSMY